MQKEIICPICQRKTPMGYQEKHHLIPKTKKGKETIIVCISCGDMLHQLFDNNFLKNNLNTIEKINNNEKVQNWVNWIKKKPDLFTVCMAKKKRK